MKRFPRDRAVRGRHARRRLRPPPRIGRSAAIPTASRRWCCTAAPARAARPASGGGSIRRRTGSCSSTSATAGRSTPHASEPESTCRPTRPPHLIDDCERIRAHLGIDRWLVWGGSWGTTLGLAYGQAHPERVTEMILVSVVTTTRREVEWITRVDGPGVPGGVGSLPRRRARSRPGRRPRCGLQPVAPRRRRAHVREQAARAWCEWEDTHVATYRRVLTRPALRRSHASACASPGS